MLKNVIKLIQRKNDSIASTKLYEASESLTSERSPSTFNDRYASSAWQCFQLF